VDNVPLRASGFVVGGLFIGAWLFLAIFETRVFTNLPNAQWWFWGVMGLLVAAGLFASRLPSVALRIAVWIGLGITIGMLALAALFLQQMSEAFAALLTVSGGAIIVASLPGSWIPQGQQPYVDPQEMEEQGHAQGARRY
jgi:hypothetical protein